MKLRIREQFICCLFAVILFLTGMCVEIPHADTSFSYAKEVSLTGDGGSVLQDGSNVTILDNVCAISMLRRDTTTFFDNKGRRMIRNFWRNVVILLASQALLFFIFFYGMITDWSALRLCGSHATIVRYIQQKDGKK